MNIGFLQPHMDEPDGAGTTVLVDLYDRSPHPDLRAPSSSGRSAAVPAARHVGRLTVEFDEPTEGAGASDGVHRVELQSAAAFVASDLHQFPWSRVIKAASTHRQARRSNRIADWQQAARAQAELDAAVVQAKRSVGRPRLPLTFYAVVAERYRALVMEGVDNPTQTIADERDVPRATAASWVSRARKQGFLAPGKPGRVG